MAYRLKNAAHGLVGLVCMSVASVATSGCFQGHFLGQTCIEGTCPTGTSSASSIGSSSDSSLSGQDSESDTTAGETTSGTSDSGVSTTAGEPDMAVELEPRAFRLTSLSLVDPHVYAPNPPPCTDITELLNQAVLPQEVDNPEQSVVFLFPAYDPKAGHGDGQLLHIYPAVCNGNPPTQCRPSGAATILVAHTYTSGSCQDVEVETINSANYGQLSDPKATCFNTEPGLLSMSLLGQGADAVMHDATIAGAFNQPDDPQAIYEGYLSGFILEKTARALEYDVFGEDLSLWSMIQGAEACMHPSMPPPDVDVHTLYGEDELGAWGYFNLEAAAVDWNPNPI